MKDIRNGLEISDDIYDSIRFYHIVDLGFDNGSEETIIENPSNITSSKIWYELLEPYIIE